MMSVRQALMLAGLIFSASLWGQDTFTLSGACLTQMEMRFLVRRFWWRKTCVWASPQMPKGNTESNSQARDLGPSKPPLSATRLKRGR